MKEQLICSVCGAILTDETANYFDNQVMCEHCLDEQTTVCDCCHERIWRDEAEGDSHTTLCSRCYEYHYTTCEHCGRLIHHDDAYYDDDYPYCESCYNHIQQRPIKSYNYKPEPIFYGSGNLFYGTELEIDKGGEYTAMPKYCLKLQTAVTNICTANTTAQ